MKIYDLLKQFHKILNALYNHSLLDIISVKLPKRIEPKNCAADVECVKNEQFNII